MGGPETHQHFLRAAVPAWHTLGPTPSKRVVLALRLGPSSGTPRDYEDIHDRYTYFFPMLSNSLLSAVESRLASGSESRRVIRLSSIEKACL
jgi:hypothetical protein